MNKTCKEIHSILTNNGGAVKPKAETVISFIGHITYVDEVVDVPINGRLLSVEFSRYDNEAEYTIISLMIEHGDSDPLCVDYFFKKGFTDIYFEGLLNGEYECFNETLDKNVPIKVWRQVLKSIK